MSTDRDESFNEWLATRPPVIQALGAKLKPWKVYTLSPTGQLCYPISFNENGTLSIFAWYAWSGAMLGHGVFGINPDDMTDTGREVDSISDGPEDVQ